MSWQEVRTLDDLKRLDPRIGDAFTRKSLDFFLPSCAHTRWDPERKPWNPATLILRPNQPVSRAWDALFHTVISRLAPPGFGAASYRMSPPSRPGEFGPRFPWIELADTDSPERERNVRGIKLATDVTNAVIADARAACEREHDELACDLGLDRPSVGFTRAAL